MAKDNGPESKSWFQTLPAILSGVALIVTATTGLIAALQGGGQEKAASSLEVRQPAVVQVHDAPKAMVPASSQASIANLPQPTPAPSAEPSFSCSKASSPVERLICANATFAELDVKVSAAYQTALHLAPSSDQNKLKVEQSGWLQQRDACGDQPSDMATCLQRAYERRFAMLQQPSPSPLQNPSFSCVKASNAVENTICANPALAELDVKVNAAYQTALRSTSQSGQATLKAGQADWRRQRDACNNNPAQMARCLQQAYQNRLGTLTNGNFN